MQFIQHRHRSYILSAFLVVFAVCMFTFAPRNLGIDMTGGVQITYTSSTVVDSDSVERIQSTLRSFPEYSSFLDVVVYPIEGATSFRVEVGIDPSLPIQESDELSQAFRVHMAEEFSAPEFGASESAYVKIGNSLGTYVRQTATFTIAVSLVLIALYLTYSFRGSMSGWSNLTFGIITLITLLHDVLIAAGFYIFFGLIFPFLEIDTFFVTALLTILGYSINDTIVILDRIRSGLKKTKKNDSSRRNLFESAIGSSVRRSLFTSLTLIFVLLVLLIIGPTQLLGFVVLLLLGAIVGTYSSLFIAAPLVYDIEKRLSGAKK